MPEAVQALRRDCAEKRTCYLHAKSVYGSAIALGLQTIADLTALRAELEQSLVAYYAAHSALHSALRQAAPSPRRRLLN
ncbi:MAG TPA: hypothetical protein VFM93_10060 [Candidatus Limnocylindria bacterium]|nr:hypothetical protein [Candidatus Limnocylindria bacterium]